MILIGCHGEGEESAYDRVGEPHVKRDRLGAKVAESVLQVLAEWSSGDRFDGHCKDETVLLV